MVKINAREGVPLSVVPKETKVISTTSTIKKKSNGTFRTQVDAQEFSCR